MAFFLNFISLLSFSTTGIYCDENNVKYFNESFYESYQAKLSLFRAENENAFPGGIVFIGNSITQGFDVKRFFPGVIVYNRGIVGDQLGIGDYAGVSKRLGESCFDLDPVAVFLMIGINDIGARPVSRTATGYASLLKAILDSLPMVELYVQSVLPTSGDYSGLNPSVDSLNSLLQEIVDEMSLLYYVRFIDLSTQFKDSTGRLKSDYSYDGLHLSQSGFAKWAEFINPLIYKNTFFMISSDSTPIEDLYGNWQDYGQ